MQRPFEKPMTENYQKLAKPGPRTPADEMLIVETSLVSSRQLVCRVNSEGELTIHQQSNWVDKLSITDSDLEQYWNNLL